VFELLFVRKERTPVKEIVDWSKMDDDKVTWGQSDEGQRDRGQGDQEQSDQEQSDWGTN
jgi:hypothetical protein